MREMEARLVPASQSTAAVTALNRSLFLRFGRWDADAGERALDDLVRLFHQHHHHPASFPHLGGWKSIVFEEGEGEEVEGEEWEKDDNDNDGGDEDGARALDAVASALCTRLKGVLERIADCRRNGGVDPVPLLLFDSTVDQKQQREQKTKSEVMKKKKMGEKTCNKSKSKKKKDDDKRRHEKKEEYIRRQQQQTEERKIKTKHENWKDIMQAVRKTGRLIGGNRTCQIVTR